MSYRKKILTGIVAIIIVTGIYNLYFPKFLVIGEYVAYIEDNFATFGINNGDTLVLHDVGTFYCDSWGYGTYMINGSEITFKYGNTSHKTYFNRPLFFGQPRIIIFRDLKSEFVKK